MNARRSTISQISRSVAHSTSGSIGFTLIEVLVVISIIALLITILGVALTNSVRKAREAATITLLQKIDGLVEERVKGFERGTKSRDFQRYVESRKRALEREATEDQNNNGVLDAGEDTNGNGVIDRGIFGVSSKVIASIARKDFFRQLFPQRFEDLGEDGEDLNFNGVLDLGEDVNGNGILDSANGVVDRLERVVGVGPTQIAVLQRQGPAIPTNPSTATAARDVTESSELLHYALTQMEVFGVPPVGESDFDTSELRDTDGDGLMEFIDGWGRPLRFYRWPTRLLKPGGVFGLDGKPGNAGADDDGNGLYDDAIEIGRQNTDDYRALNPISGGMLFGPDAPLHLPRRELAGLLIDGMPPAPAKYLQSGNWNRVRYDPVDEDPDDPYGLIVSEMQKLARGAPGAPGINVLEMRGYVEGVYPTLDTYHTPLVVSVGPDGVLGLFEPFVFADMNGDGLIDYGVLAQPIYTTPNPNDIPVTTFSALADNLTNRNRRAGRGK